MSKAPTLPTLVGGYQSAAALNAILQDILNALQNTLSRDGSAPNQMNADLDLNGNDILNAGSIEVDDIEVDGQSLSGILSQLQDAITTLGNVDDIDQELQVTLTQIQALVAQVADTEAALGEWRGSWTTATSYVVGDRVAQAGSSYICVVAHTSGVFATDLAANRWNLFAAKGTDGLGAGDLIAANNLSDVASAATARANLNAQELNTLLTAIAGLASNGLVARTGSGTAASRTITGTTDQITVTNGDGASGNPTVAAVVASQAEAEAGVNNTKLMTALRVKQSIDANVPAFPAPAFTDEETSWYNTNYSWSHGLGRLPRNVQFYLECTTAVYGYSIGDRIVLGSGQSYGTNFWGIHSWVSPTQIGVTTVRITLFAKNSSSLAYSLTSNANWKLVVEAW